MTFAVALACEASPQALDHGAPSDIRRPVDRPSIIGRPLPRFEDLRLTRGAGRYTDDIDATGATYAALVRAPHAHAAIVSIDVAAAMASPGVLTVLTGADYRADGLRGIPHTPVPADALDVSMPAFRPEHGFVLDQSTEPLAVDIVRALGEPVAIVVAETLAQARDAAEMVEVAYEMRPAVTDVHAALAPDAPLLWPSAPGNRCLDVAFGDAEATAKALDASTLRLDRDFVNQRIVNCQMEPRTVLGSYDETDQKYTLFAGTQGVARQRVVLAAALAVPVGAVRVVTHDVGGGFGPRTFLDAESVLACWAAKRIGRSVKWTSTRSEAFLTDYGARDLVTRVKIGFDHDGRIRAMDVELVGSIGAQPVAYVPLANGYRLISTVYHVPVAHVHVVGVMTNTPPTVAFRGAGRPEAVYAIERLLDMAAHRLGLDRLEIRRRNLVPHRAMPYRNIMGLTYDCGDFAKNMDGVLAHADWAGFEERRKVSAGNGLRRGIGIANYVETPVGAPRERVDVAVRTAGIDIVAGTQSTGQGHETSFAQVVAERLGVDVDRVRLLTGDTDRMAQGGGSHSNRSMRIAGTLMVQATDIIVANGRERAARLLGVAPAAVSFRGGLFGTASSNRQFSVFDLVESDGEPLTASQEFVGRIPAFPTGCAICEVEVDPETGVVVVVRYTTVDDVGQAINPLIVEGQTHGGIAQGIGQALLEGAAWDSEGQMITGSFMDYAMARASDLPSYDVYLDEDPTSGNPLRVKGGGEGGITPAPAAVINAIVDALSEDGVEDLIMPATPYTVWRAMRDARRAQGKGGAHGKD
jgi:carbon-monoxide dehydrogenase large subunit